MSIDRVKHGETFNLAGTLAAGETLIGLTGDPAALIAVDGTAKNHGTIELYGARLPHKQGATLNVAGVLTNGGAISVGGAINSTHAALLQITGTLTNKATLTGQAGTYGAGARIDVQGGGRLGNFGTLTLAAGARSGSLGATLADKGVLFNNKAGTIDIAGAVGAFVNGHYTSGSGGVLNVSGTFTNDGALSLHTALYSAAANAGATVSVGGLLQNTGSVYIGAYSYGAQGQFDPYATGGALLTVGGTLSNTGAIYVAGGASGFETSYGVRSTLAIGGSLVNHGQITLQPGGIGGHYATGGQGALLQDSGNIDNGGLLLVQGSSPFYPGFPENGATIIDAGVLTNNGTVLQEQNTGLRILGTITNNALLQAEGGSSFYYLAFYKGGGASISLEGVMTNSGTLSLDGGVTGPLSFYNDTFFYGLGAQLGISGLGVLTNTGRVNISGGEGGNHPFGGRLTPDSTGTGATLSIAGVTGAAFVNYGTINVMAGQYSSHPYAGTGGLLIDGGFLNNQANAVITLNGGVGTANGELLISAGGVLTNSGTVNGTGVLLNQGLVFLGDGHTRIDVASFINDGTIETAYTFGRQDTISSAITADNGKGGTLTLTASVLRLGGAVAPSQTIVFKAAPYSNAQTTLVLADLAAFAGTLSGLAGKDIIDFAARDITSATAAGTTLAIGSSSGASYSLALAAPLTGLSLTLQSDGNGGTDLLFSTTPASHV